jgi:hypothetical protein
VEWLWWSRGANIAHVLEYGTTSTERRGFMSTHHTPPHKGRRESYIDVSNVQTAYRGYYGGLRASAPILLEDRGCINVGEVVTYDSGMQAMINRAFKGLE